MRVAKDMQLLMLKICGLRAVNTILDKTILLVWKTMTHRMPKVPDVLLTPAFPISKMEMKKVYF